MFIIQTCVPTERTHNILQHCLLCSWIIFHSAISAWLFIRSSLGQLLFAFYTLPPSFPLTSVKDVAEFLQAGCFALKTRGEKLNAYEHILWSDKGCCLLLTDLLAARVCKWLLLPQCLCYDSMTCWEGVSLLCLFHGSGVLHQKKGKGKKKL